MEITCPQCRFTRSIPDEKIPDRAEIATCPKCKHKFKFRDLANEPAASTPPEQPTLASPSPARAQAPPKKAPQEEAATQPEPRVPKDEIWDKLASLGQPHQEAHGASTASPPASEGIEVPWEHLDKYGFFPGLWETIKRAMLQPAAFFQSMPVGSGQIKPLIFYLLIAEFQIVMQMLWDMTGIGADATGEAAMAGVNTVVLLVVYPLLLTMMLYIMTALVHLCLHLVGAATRGFEGTFRALTYGSAPMVLVIIPLAGPLIGAIWSLVVTFLGYKHIHRTTTGKVLLAMLLPLIPFALLLVLALSMAQQNGAPAF